MIEVEASHWKRRGQDNKRIKQEKWETQVDPETEGKLAQIRSKHIECFFQAHVNLNDKDEVNETYLTLLYSPQFPIPIASHYFTKCDETIENAITSLILKAHRSEFPKK